MGLARRRERTWTERWRESAAAAALGRWLPEMAEKAREAAGAVRYQVAAGWRPSGGPRYLHWHDGRRFRATAAGRRRGAVGAAEPLMLRPGAIVSMVVILAVAIASFVSSSALYLRFASDLPDARSITQLSLPQDSLVYDSSGTIQLADLHQQGYRHYEQQLKDMGPWIPKATIAIEDANFYNEPGIDIQAMVRAAWVDYHDHKVVQGASTITQQLVKMRLVGNEVSIDRKAREAILAIQVEQDFTKDQILEMYLNTAFYGNSAYGIQAAAQNYFHKQTKDLTLGESSMLTGIVQNPSYNNPLVNWDGSRVRQHAVLAAMVRNHYITQEQADQAFAQDISEANGHLFRDAEIVQAPAFIRYVTDELKALYGRDAVYRDGFRVTTTLNWDLEQKAQELISAQVSRYQGMGYNVHQGAMVALDPRTGGVLAMVGSANPNDNGGQYNFAVWPPRNPGSSMKMYNYTAAIASGLFTMVTPIPDSPISISQGPGEKPWTPQNYDSKLHGTCQLQACFLNSLNIPAVRVELGLPHMQQDTAAMARLMGAPPWTYHGDTGKFTDNDPIESYGPSLTLGGYGETPLQMAQGAQVLAGQGFMRPAHGVDQVASPDGQVLMKRDPNKDGKQVLDPRVAFIMEQIMSDDSNRAMIFGRGSNLTLSDRPVASKTGTTDDFKDGWTIGYTPAISSAFWFGNPDWTVMGRALEASVIAAPVWHDFMQYALRDSLKRPNTEWFGEPAGLQHFNVGGKLQWFLPGTSPSTPTPQPKGVIVSMPAPAAPTHPPNSDNGGGSGSASP